MNKEWKNIKGYEQFYKISNYGEVKVKRRVVYKVIEGELQPVYVTKEQIMKPFDNGNGYLVVTLSDGKGNSKNYYVHRLVAETFLLNENNLPQVDHIDYDRKNNRVSNLRWVMASENIKHSSCNHPKTHKGCHSGTGYKYIYFRKSKYRVVININNKEIDKCFSDLETAIAFRNHVLKECGIDVEDNID